MYFYPPLVCMHKHIKCILWDCALFFTTIIYMSLKIAYKPITVLLHLCTLNYTAQQYIYFTINRYFRSKYYILLIYYNIFEILRSLGISFKDDYPL